MQHIVSTLADLTALRDRQSLDSALVQTLMELLDAHTVSINRLVGMPGNEHWLVCASQDQSGQCQLPPQSWIELDELPRAEDLPLRLQARATRQPVFANGIHIFPLTAQSGNGAVMELQLPSTLAPEQVIMVTGVTRLYQNFLDLLDYGERDALTDLLNRKTFDGAFLKATTGYQEGTAAIASDDRRNVHTGAGVVWLAVIDIDHFKRVNDNFGHLIGDEVLLLLARLMRSTFRFHDQLYRFGGEEFVVLMRCVDDQQAETALQRLRTNTEKQPFPQVGNITVSIGYTDIRRGDSPASAFERADKALYYAKENGRNRCCSYATLLEEGQITAKPKIEGGIELF